MARRVMVVIGAALLAAGGFGAVLGIIWAVLRLVLGVFPYILQSRLHALAGVVPALFVLVAFVGAGCAAVALASRPGSRGNSHDSTLRAKFRS